MGLSYVAAISCGLLLVTGILAHIGQTLGDMENIVWIPGGWSVASAVSFSIAGGFTECRKVQAMASANGVRVLPHMWGTSIRLAATLHWQATIPDDPESLHPQPSLFEFDMTENALRTELALEPLRAVDGEVEVPQGPGLGIEIDRDLLERYS